MTATERDALIERAMERLNRLREREEAEAKFKPPELVPALGIVRRGGAVIVGKGAQ